MCISSTSTKAVAQCLIHRSQIVSIPISIWMNEHLELTEHGESPTLLVWVKLLAGCWRPHADKRICGDFNCFFHYFLLHAFFFIAFTPKSSLMSRKTHSGSSSAEMPKNASFGVGMNPRIPPQNIWKYDSLCKVPSRTTIPSNFWTAKKQTKDASGWPVGRWYRQIEWCCR